MDSREALSLRLFRNYCGKKVLQVILWVIALKGIQRLKTQRLKGHSEKERERCS
jgi:hypothetical protein